MMALWAFPAAAQKQALIQPSEWEAYQTHFIASEGRVIDDANGNISHSEGQGYGLLLAYYAGDQPAFERIWSFTRTQLLLRDDGLAAWKWDPEARPNITDINNASDGDLLIAYALSLAGEDWENAGYWNEAARLADALGGTSIYSNQGETILSPAVDGFSRVDRPDGPVINLSYWVFEAFPAMERLAPDHAWDALAESGKALLRRVIRDEPHLPPDWLSIRHAPSAARGFDPHFSYNALRIPLYLLRAGEEDEALLRPMNAAMTGDNGELQLVDVKTGAVVESLSEPGYRIIPALAACAIDGTRIPEELLQFQPTRYYPSTLHLLALAHLREEATPCA